MQLAFWGDKIPVCTVIGFPLGAMTTEAKVFEAKDAVEKGAKEVIWLQHRQGQGRRFAYIEDETDRLNRLWATMCLKLL